MKRKAGVSAGWPVLTFLLPWGPHSHCSHLKESMSPFVWLCFLCRNKFAASSQVMLTEYTLYVRYVPSGNLSYIKKKSSYFIYLFLGPVILLSLATCLTTIHRLLGFWILFFVFFDTSLFIALLSLRKGKSKLCYLQNVKTVKRNRNKHIMKVNSLFLFPFFHWSCLFCLWVSD